MDLAREFRRFKRWTTVCGTRYLCPFCHRPQRKFLPAGAKEEVLDALNVVGGGYRNNAKCFVCGSMDRERLVYLYLKHQTSLFREGGRVLHVAPEPLLMKTIQKQKKIHYIRANITKSRADVSFDIAQIPFKDDTFDVVIMNHVLEHIPNDHKAMLEILRVLKRETGRAILQVPISLNLSQTLEDNSISTDEDRLRVFGQEDHVRLYGQDYPEKLMQAGFTVDVFDWKTDKAMARNNNKYGLIDNEKFFVGSKQIGQQS